MEGSGSCDAVAVEKELSAVDFVVEAGTGAGDDLAAAAAVAEAVAVAVATVAAAAAVAVAVAAVAAVAAAAAAGKTVALTFFAAPVAYTEPEDELEGACIGTEEAQEQVGA
jgi:hypothetical protein